MEKLKEWMANFERRIEEGDSDEPLLFVLMFVTFITVYALVEFDDVSPLLHGLMIGLNVAMIIMFIFRK